MKKNKQVISTLNGKVELISLKDVANMIGIGVNEKKCSKNGLKISGSSCSKNNKCIYPKCLK